MSMKTKGRLSTCRNEAGMSMKIQVLSRSRAGMLLKRQVVSVVGGMWQVEQKDEIAGTDPTYHLPSTVYRYCND